MHLSRTEFFPVIVPRASDRTLIMLKIVTETTLLSHCSHYAAVVKPSKTEDKTREAEPLCMLCYILRLH
jgi:hypothetical protein